MATKVKKAAEKAVEPQVEEKKSYLTMDQIPWDALKERFGISRRDFEGDSSMSKGRREALLSGNWTPTVDGYAKEEGISSDLSLSLRARQVIDKETGEVSIRVYAESPIHEALGCEMKYRDVTLPQDVRDELAKTHNAGRIVELEIPVFEDGKRVPLVASKDIKLKDDVIVDGEKIYSKDEVIKAGSELKDFKTGKPLYKTEKNKYFLSINPYTRKVKGMIASKNIIEGIKFPEFYDYIQRPNEDKLAALREGKPVPVVCRGKNGGEFVQCLQYNAASGLVEHNEHSPKYKEALDMFFAMRKGVGENPQEEKKQGMSL